MSKLLQIFAKAPELGKVKTRLAANVGQEAALALHKYLVESSVHTAKKTTADEVQLWTTSNSAMEYFAELGCPVFLQQGHDLGERMQHALEVGLVKHQQVVLIGADAYSLSNHDMDQAFSALLNHDMVFTPALDGGYVLVGASDVIGGVFDDVPWGTEQVFDVTQQKLASTTHPVAVLNPRWDIDTLDDIEQFAPHLMEQIKQY